VSKNSSGFKGMAYIASYLQGDGTTNASSKLVFATSNGTSIYQRMFIDKDGNVSVGTSEAKGYTFAVNGSAIATSVTVKLNSIWPDYVFKPHYVLPSLSSVSSFIKEHQHLPEIPSEQEIIKNGLDLGEMNKLLMKKVEELTLYAIESEQKNDAQEKRIKLLETKLEFLLKKTNN
jgi:hypothetical protein